LANLPHCRPTGDFYGDDCFCSYTFVKRLKATGFTEEQAEVIVDASRDALDSLVTKEDLKVLDVSLRNEIQAMELRLTIKLGAFMAVVGIIIAVLRMPH
jgi:hypothetical protein